MRRACAIIKATALELLSEPLVLVMISAMTLSVMAPAVHYHDFGEPSRMARDAGVSAIMVGGLVIVAFGTIKTIRRELESQTAMSALALSVSRRLFFLSKLLGVLVAYLFYVITVGAVSLAAVRGAIIGSEIAAQNHTMVRMYGPVYVLSIAAFVLPFLYGAIVNRYFHRRFTLNANLCAFVLALRRLGSIWICSSVCCRCMSWSRVRRSCSCLLPRRFRRDSGLMRLHRLRSSSLPFSYRP